MDIWNGSTTKLIQRSTRDFRPAMKGTDPNRLPRRIGQVLSQPFVPVVRLGRRRQVMIKVCRQRGACSATNRMHCSIDNDRCWWSAQIIFLWLGWFCFGNASAVADESQPSRGLTDTTATAHVQLHSVGLAETKWTHGLWADRFETCRKNSLPTLATIVLGDHASQTPSQYLGNFNVAAGKVQGKHRGALFNDGDFYKWLEAVAAVFAATKDPTLDRMMDESIESIAAAAPRWLLANFDHRPPAGRRRRCETVHRSPAVRSV